MPKPEILPRAPSAAPLWIFDTCQLGVVLRAVLAVQLLLHRIQGIGPAGPQVIRLQHKLRPGEEERGAWGCADSRPGEG